jgi:dolichol-phosphate mannosyltransferase
MPPRILVSSATYNERENIADLAAAVLEQLPDAHFLVTDDNSPDGTGQLVDDMAARDPRVHVQHRAGKLGLGTAIVAGMRYAIAHGYDIFVNIDADFSHHPKYLPALIAGMDRHDVMIGSRYVPGGGVKDWPWKRQMMSQSINAFARIALGLPARDCSGGYRVYRVSKLAQIDLGSIRSRGYSFQQEMLFRCVRIGCRVGETPIIFEDRRAGKSKVNMKEAARSLGTIALLGLHNLVDA